MSNTQLLQAAAKPPAGRGRASSARERITEADELLGERRDGGLEVAIRPGGEP